MFHALIQHIEVLLYTYGVLGVFVAALIEEMVAPIPSTLIVFTAGLVMTKELVGMSAVIALLLKVVLPASVGMTLGSLFPYYIARIGEKVVIERFGKYLRIDWSTIEKIQAWTKKTSSDELIIFGTRAIPGIPTMAVSIIAGLARIPVAEYLLYTFLGCLIRTSILAGIGWVGGRKMGYVMEIFSVLDDHLLIVLSAVLFSIIAAWLVLRRRPKNQAA